MATVWVLLFHDVWDVARIDGESGPEDVSIDGIFTTQEAAAAAQAAAEHAFPSTDDYYTIEAHAVNGG